MKKDSPKIFRPRLSLKARQILGKGGPQTTRRGARGYDRRRDKKIIQRQLATGRE